MYSLYTFAAILSVVHLNVKKITCVYIFIEPTVRLGLGLGFIMSFLGWRLSYKGTPDPPLETDTPNFVTVDRTSPQT